MLELVDVSKRVGAELHIDSVSLTLTRGELNVGKHTVRINLFPPAPFTAHNVRFVLTEL